MEDKNLFILHGQYHGCWCLGDVRSQGISSHVIDIVSNCSNRRVKTAFWLLKYLKMLGGVVHLCRLFFTQEVMLSISYWVCVRLQQQLIINAWHLTEILHVDVFLESFWCVFQHIFASTAVWLLCSVQNLIMIHLLKDKTKQKKTWASEILQDMSWKFPINLLFYYHLVFLGQMACWHLAIQVHGWVITYRMLKTMEYN